MCKEEIKRPSGQRGDLDEVSGFFVAFCDGDIGGGGALVAVYGIMGDFWIGFCRAQIYSGFC